MFCLTVVIGTLVGISSVDWVGVWFGLEINMFSAVPLVLGTGSPSEAESAAKYFLMQAAGSAVLLFGVLLNVIMVGIVYVTPYLTLEIPLIIICLGLMMKVGLVPFHFWLPSVMSGLTWEACFLLSVWQKVGPLLVMISFVEGTMMHVLLVSGCLSSVVGGLGGFSQSQFRVLLGYSTIGHSGWLVAGGMYSILSAISYFLLYAIIMSFLVYFLSVISITSCESVSKMFGTVSIDYLVFLSLLWLSLAGLPPTIGFAMKWAVILAVCAGGGLVAVVFLVLGSLLSLYYYSCLAFSLYLLSDSILWEVPEDFYKPVLGVMGIGGVVIFGYPSFLMVSQICG